MHAPPAWKLFGQCRPTTASAHHVQCSRHPHQNLQMRPRAAHQQIHDGSPARQWRRILSPPNGPRAMAPRPRAQPTPPPLAPRRSSAAMAARNTTSPGPELRSVVHMMTKPMISPGAARGFLLPTTPAASVPPQPALPAIAEVIQQQGTSTPVCQPPGYTPTPGRQTLGVQLALLLVSSPRPPRSSSPLQHDEPHTSCDGHTRGHTSTMVHTPTPDELRNFNRNEQLQ